ncbi:MAG TPA: hypothetical protein VFG04_04240 [Planctomycetaceae bacterium]|nr:hypothetical protein [Planctomycetaceae bacterium]
MKSTESKADFKFSQIAGIPQDSYSKLGLKNRDIAKVGATFVFNMHRVSALGRLPEMTMFQWAWRLDHSGDAELASMGCGRREAKSAIDVMRRFLLNIDRLLDRIPGDGMQFAIENVFFSMIQGTWTTFEVLAGDLWEAAINVCPQRLFKLHGREKRIEKAVEDRIASDKKLMDKSRVKTKHVPPESIVEKNEKESKKVDLVELGSVSGDTFDLRNKMGSLLRTKYELNTLRKIRAAYSLAFDHPPVKAIDDALTCRAFDALGAVRNVIVHKGGVADQEYVAKTEGIPNAPRLAKGQKLSLDGVSTFNLISLVVAQEVALLKAVDAFASEVKRGRRV